MARAGQNDESRPGRDEEKNNSAILAKKSHFPPLAFNF